MTVAFLRPAKLFWLAFSFACLSPQAWAQTHHWVPTVICEKCTPRGYVYGDSLHHVMVIGKQDQKGSFRYTDNGGANFHEPSFVDPSYYVNYVIGYSFSSYIAPSSYYLFLGAVTWASTDNGQSWAYRGDIGTVAAGAHMFNASYGMLVNYGKISKSIVTQDSAKTFSEPKAAWDQPGRGIFFQDSTKLWRINPKVVSFSWDQGLTWQGSLPEDSAGQDIIYTYLQQTNDTNRVYLIGGPRDKSDFYISTDAGISWKEIHATGQSRVQRVAEQTPDRLWLMVSRRPTFAPDDVFEARSGGRFSDTLYYSTNSGSTWEKDLSFVGDTISELQFHGPNDGFAVSTHDSTVRFWRYVEDPAAVDRIESLDSSSMYVHPNPNAGEFKYFPRLGGICLLRLTDLFGRVVHEEVQELVHMRESTFVVPDPLPNGIYFLELIRGDSRAGQQFILQR